MAPRVRTAMCQRLELRTIKKGLLLMAALIENVLQLSVEYGFYHWRIIVIYNFFCIYWCFDFAYLREK